MRTGSRTARLVESRLVESAHFRKWPAQSGQASTLRRYPTSANFKFGGPKEARPRPSGIGGLQGQGRAGHASTRDLRNQFRFFSVVPRLLIIVPKFCRTDSASVQTKAPDRLSLALDVG